MAETTNTPTAEDLAKALAAPAAPAPAATKLRYEVGPNSVFEGDTPEEVIEKMVKAQQSANQHIETLRSEKQSLIAQQQERDEKGRFLPQQPDAAPASGAWDQEKYFKMFTESPDKANEYWLETHPDALVGAIGKVFGIAPDKVVPTFSSTIQNSQMQYDAMVGDQFLVQCPDFPVG